MQARQAGLDRRSFQHIWPPNGWQVRPCCRRWACYRRVTTTVRDNRSTPLAPPRVPGPMAVAGLLDGFGGEAQLADQLPHLLDRQRGVQRIAEQPPLMIVAAGGIEL